MDELDSISSSFLGATIYIHAIIELFHKNSILATSNNLLRVCLCRRGSYLKISFSDFFCIYPLLYSNNNGIDSIKVFIMLTLTFMTESTILA